MKPPHHIGAVDSRERHGADGFHYRCTDSNTILGFGANVSGDSAPIQTIGGGSTGLSVPLGIALEE